MITYQTETYDEIIDDIEPILEDHYAETELYHQVLPLNPDYQMYRAGNEHGIIHFYTARDDYDLVGYIIMMVANKPHSKDALYGMCDMIYVAPEYRHTEVAPELIQYAEGEIKNQGADVVLITLKAHSKADSLMKSLGYEESDVSYSKFIKE